MSSIRKEGGVWAYYARIGGKQVHRSLQTGDRRQAIERQKVLDLDLQKSRWQDPRMRWENFRQTFEAWSRARKPHGTFKNDELALRRLTEVLAPGLLTDITRERAESFITTITSTPWKGRTTSNAGANFYIRTLRAIFTIAVDWKMLEENPFRGVKVLPADLPAPRILTRSEIARIFRSMRAIAPLYEPLISFYLVTGMRRSEALRLEWKDVNFESGVLTVARAKGRRPRLIPMAPPARRILMARKGESKPFDWYPSSVNRVFRQVRHNAKLDDVTIHDLRRTFGTMLAQAGVNALFIQQWMGHSDPMVTREHYIGLPQETRRQLGALQRIIPK